MKARAKKRLVAAIVASLTLAAAAPAFAAANPFVDVPAKHWAYDSVSKLAAAGIVDGYGDGTFRGDRTMTRYEMAQIVAKAMARSDKANAEQKAMIDKLAQEFGDELHNLGVRVSNLENKVGNITWTGQVREWYDWVDDGHAQEGSHALKTRILLWANAPLTNNLSFTGRFWAESNWGERDNGGWNTGDGTGADTSLDQAYLTYKKGNTTATFGRQPITLGKGLTYNYGESNDGVTVTVGSDKLKVTGAAFKSWAVPLSKSWYSQNIVAANVAYQATPDLDFTLVYLKNKSSYDGWKDMVGLDTWALGVGYKGIKNITLTGEYGRNTAECAKDDNVDGSAPKAWVGQIKYKGAEWTKPHTFGVWVGYRHAEPGFVGLTGDPLWEVASGVPVMDNVKGLEYGFDYTLFKNGVFTFNYMDLESETDDYWDHGHWDNKDYKSMTAQLRYFF